MSRGITLLILLFVILITMNNKLNFTQSKNNISNEVIRLRILANSDEEIDQEVKLKVKDEVLKMLKPLIEDTNNFYEAEKVIYNNLEKVREIVKNVLSTYELDMDYYVDYGLTYFPEKEYNGKIYPSGRYNALYIKIGEGKGENWWCVLFPSLCIADLATVKNINDEVEYSF